jgi:hypothetical protein
MTFARLFATFFPSFGPLFPSKALLFSRHSFPSSTFHRTCGRAKEDLRSVDKEVQQGQHDPLGRDKKCLAEEQVTKIAWQHGMDTKASSRLQEAYYKVSNCPFIE